MAAHQRTAPRWAKRSGRTWSVGSCSSCSVCSWAYSAVLIGLVAKCVRSGKRILRARGSRVTEQLAPMRAMVLAAGLGTRLRPITYAIPKPMVPVVNRPVMEHTLRLLARHGFREAIANLHWFPETIEARFGDGSELGLELSYSREERLLGTAGGVRNAAGFLGDSFLVVAGDALTDLDFAAMREFHESHDGLATVATK